MSIMRVTPLNIGCALLLAWIMWEILFNSVNWKTTLLSIILLLVLVIADQVFRFFFKTIKRIWLIELGFVVFTLLVIWIIR
jgi:hypothetical protein